jgi:hypothetical protein
MRTTHWMARAIPLPMKAVTRKRPGVGMRTTHRIARAIPLQMKAVSRKRSGEIWTGAFDVRVDLNRVSRSPGGLRRSAAIDPMRLAPLRFHKPSVRHALHRPISFRMLDRTDKHQHHHR